MERLGSYADVHYLTGDNQSDMTFITSDGVSVHINRLFFAALSGYSTCLENVLEGSVIATVELSSKDLCHVIEFCQSGCLPIEMETSTAAGFNVMGVCLDGMKFKKVERTVEVKSEEQDDFYVPGGDFDEEERASWCSYDSIMNEDILDQYLSEEDEEIDSKELLTKVKKKKRVPKKKVVKTEPKDSDYKDAARGVGKRNPIYDKFELLQGMNWKEGGECSVCKQKVNTYLKLHLIRNHIDLDLPCPDCPDLKFRSERLLKQHRRKDHNEGGSVCDICGRKLRSPKELENHHNSKHSDMKSRPFVCELCPDQGFVKKWRYDAHMNKHNGVKFYCEKCPFITYHHNHLQNHHYVKHDPNSKMTIKPNKSGKKRGIIRGRVFAPGEVENATCEHCGKHFKGKGSVMRYERHIFSLHTDEADKPYHCTICNKGFGHDTHLKSHMQCHENKRENVCQTCGVSFNHTGNLNAHVRSVHMGMKTRKRKSDLKAEEEL